jgi:hypothetical protein
MQDAITHTLYVEDMAGHNSSTSMTRQCEQGIETAWSDRRDGRPLAGDIVDYPHTHSLKWSDAGLRKLYSSILCGIDMWYDERRVRSGLPEAVSTLPVRLVAVLYLRYDKGMTLNAIGKLLPNGSRKEKFKGIVGVTTERVRQMEAKALRKMRHPSRTRMFICKQRHSLPVDIVDTYIDLVSRFKVDWQSSGYNYNAMVLGFR